jgi:hypothetical protein
VRTRLPSSGDQLARAERLGDVVVAAQLQAEDAVDLVVARGEEDDRGPVAVGAQPADDLGALESGQRDVEDAGHRAQPAGGRQPGRAVMLHVYAETVPGQVEPDQVGDRPLVLDHQDEAFPGGVAHRSIMPGPGRGRCSGNVRAGGRRRGCWPPATAGLGKRSPSPMPE